MSYNDIRLGNLLKNYLDGLPIDLVSKLLPFRSRFNLGIQLHIHLHAKQEKKIRNKSIHDSQQKVFSIQSFKGLIDNLKNTILSLKPSQNQNNCKNYYIDNTDSTYIESKKKIVSNFLSKVQPKSIWDIGSNNGYFSRTVANENNFVISFDSDALIVEDNYCLVKKNKEKNILPLLMDMNNPTSGLGWANTERISLIERSPCDLIMSLALIHHLVISNNIPFGKVAELFSKMGNHLLIEFVPKSDKNVQQLLKNRKDIFTGYTENNFEITFTRYFTILEKKLVDNSERIMYLMKNNN